VPVIINQWARSLGRSLRKRGEKTVIDGAIGGERNNAGLVIIAES